MVHKRSPPSWADYRIRTRLFWVLLLFGPIVALGTGTLWLVEHFGLHGLGWSLVAWLVAMLLATWHWQSFRCPRANAVSSAASRSCWPCAPNAVSTA